MRPEIRNAVCRAVDALPGFDGGERRWILHKVSTFLADSPVQPGPGQIPDLVRQWAKLLEEREEPVAEGQLDAAIDSAFAIHGNLTQELALFCRHLVHKWEAGGNPQLLTVGDIADFVLFAVIALQDGSTDLSLVHSVAEYRAGRVRFALVRGGHPEPTEEENAWLHGEILEDFARPEFSPFEEDRASWSRHVASLLDRIQRRRHKVTA